MLNALRKGAGTWVAKILFGLLVISFAAWGVGDWTGGFRREKLAEVGGREIASTEFERAFQTEIAVRSAQYGRQLTSEEVRRQRIADIVMNRLIGSAAVNIHADQMNLGISDGAVADSIKNDENFQGEDGKFSNTVFQEVLRNNGLNEPTFVEMHRRDLIRAQLLNSFTAAPVTPRVLIDAVNHYLNDAVVLKYFIIPADAAGTIEPPNEEMLKSYYEQHKRNFMSPDFRRASVLVLSPDKVKQAMAVSDADLKAAYEAGKKAYTVPERRTIQQLVFKDMAAAQDASAKLASGTDFVQLGKELGMTEGDINLGAVTKDGFADKTVAEAAFKLEKDKPSAPIPGFSPVIVRVTEIAPGSEKSFEEVKDQVRETLVKARSNEEISKLHDQIEDERAAGSTLAEIGQKLNLEFKEITVSRQGTDREGKKIELPGQAQAAVRLIFETDIGVENNPVTLGEDSYAFIDVAEIIPERQRPFEEVREEVAKTWVEDEARSRLTKKADELVAALGKGQSMEDAAAAVKAEVKTTQPLKRGAAEPGLPISAVSQGFTLAQGAHSSIFTPDRKNRAVFQVTSFNPAPALDDKGVQQLREGLGRGIGSDMLAQYVGGLQASYGVTRSEKAIATATGQSSSQ